MQDRAVMPDAARTVMQLQSCIFHHFVFFATDRTQRPISTEIDSKMAEFLLDYHVPCTTALMSIYKLFFYIY